MLKRTAYLVLTVASIAMPTWADQALASAKGCMACHSVDRKLVGPSYKDVAKKYAGNKEAVDQLAVKIVKGGSGVWGVLAMTANPQVNEVDAKKLASWVLSQ